MAESDAHEDLTIGGKGTLTADGQWVPCDATLNNFRTELGERLIRAIAQIADLEADLARANIERPTIDAVLIDIQAKLNKLLEVKAVVSRIKTTQERMDTAQRFAAEHPGKGQTWLFQEYRRLKREPYIHRNLFPALKRRGRPPAV